MPLLLHHKYRHFSCSKKSYQSSDSGDSIYVGNKSLLRSPLIKKEKKRKEKTKCGIERRTWQDLDFTNNVIGRRKLHCNGEQIPRCCNRNIHRLCPCCNSQTSFLALWIKLLFFPLFYICLGTFHPQYNFFSLVCPFYIALVGVFFFFPFSICYSVFCFSLCLHRLLLFIFIYWFPLFFSITSPSLDPLKFSLFFFFLTFYLFALVFYILLSPHCQLLFYFVLFFFPIFFSNLNNIFPFSLCLASSLNLSLPSYFSPSPISLCFFLSLTFVPFLYSFFIINLCLSFKRVLIRSATPSG